MVRQQYCPPLCSPSLIVSQQAAALCRTVSSTQPPRQRQRRLACASLRLTEPRLVSRRIAVGRGTGEGWERDGMGGGRKEGMRGERWDWGWRERGVGGEKGRRGGQGAVIEEQSGTGRQDRGREWSVCVRKEGESWNEKEYEQQKTTEKHRTTHGVTHTISEGARSMKFRKFKFFGCPCVSISLRTAIAAVIDRKASATARVAIATVTEFARTQYLHVPYPWSLEDLGGAF